MTRPAGGAGTVVSVNTSLKKGQIKRPVASAEIRAGRGIEGDAHRDFGHRQVSLLAVEDIEAQKARLGGGESAVPLGPGAFAENLTTRGLDLAALAVGDELVVGGDAPAPGQSDRERLPHQVRRLSPHRRLHHADARDLLRGPERRHGPPGRRD